MQSRRNPPLVLNALEENVRDLDGVYRQHGHWLLTLLRRRFGREAAEDLAQEAYLRIADRPPSEPIQNPRGLLMTVASNLARDTFRRDRVRADHTARAAGDVGPFGADHWTAEDDLQVREAILSLPPKLRDVLLLSKIGGLTNREIAQRYGFPRRRGRGLARLARPQRRAAQDSA